MTACMQLYIYALTNYVFTLLRFGDFADFRAKIQFFHTPPLFHQECQDDPLRTDRCFLATTLLV